MVAAAAGECVGSGRGEEAAGSWGSVVSDRLVRVRCSDLKPEYQDGDWVQVRRQESAEDGQVCVVGLDDGTHLLRRWPVEGARVVGVVVEMYRRVD